MWGEADREQEGSDRSRLTIAAWTKLRLLACEALFFVIERFVKKHFEIGLVG
jgi:hypothetical protein